MGDPSDTEVGPTRAFLAEWLRQQSFIQQALQPITPQLGRQFAAMAASVRLASPSILQAFNLPQALYAREILAGLQIPQLSVDATLFRSILRPASSIIAEAFAPLAQQQLLMASQLQEQMSRWMQSFQAACGDPFRPLGTLIKRIGEAEEVKEAFESAKLWVAPSMSRRLVARVFELHKGGAGPGVIASAVSRSYARAGWAPLVGAVERWHRNPLFRGRMRVFQDALDAHRGGRFTLTVPALVAQVEGICGQYVKRRKLLVVYQFQLDAPSRAC